MAKGDAEKHKERLKEATKNALGKGTNPGIMSQAYHTKKDLEKKITDKDSGDKSN